MANPFSQRVRQRKFIYLALIVVLFTVSLLHRHFLIKPEADRLRLREAARGKADLTGTAVRLSLIGSRGITVTFLWNIAIQEQRRHEWNRLELTVGAITKLQPYFITPWLYQGWNLAYNVAVECDRPHDKYYYVSRGLNLLAEGERRNHEQGINPGDPNDLGVGQPDLRHYIGIAYLGKFGYADEKYSMRSLLDMSCIDPVRRDPQRFWTVDREGRKAVNLQELAKLARDYPRFVRRLREHLGYANPEQIVEFLTANRELPNRFETPTGSADQVETRLKADFRQQFPILPDPSKRGQSPPNPLLEDFGLTDESFDVHVVARAWFEYAQQPLPPPYQDVLEEAQHEGKIDRSKYRRPKAPSTPIFRSYPARAQEYVAEVMQEEGWFDADGWLIRDWFDGDLLGTSEFRVGTHPKYHSGPAWKRAFEAYRKFGLETGQLYTPEREAEMQRNAEYFRAKFNVKPGEPVSLSMLGTNVNDPKLVEGLKDHQRLFLRDSMIRLTNFNGHYHQCEAEMTSQAVLARKYFYSAQRLRSEDPDQSLALYQAAWPQWLTTCVRFPKFNEAVMDEAYEQQLRYLRLMQRHHSSTFRAVVTGLAQWSVWPHMRLDELLEPNQKGSIVPIRASGGPLDAARVYQGKHKTELGQFLLAWSSAAGVPRLYLFPTQDDWALVAMDFRHRPLPNPPWDYLTPDYTIQSVRQRLNLTPAPTPPTDSQLPPPPLPGEVRTPPPPPMPMELKQ